MIKLEYVGMSVSLPRKGFTSYPHWIAKLMGAFIERKQRQGFHSVDIIRVTHQDDPSKLSIYFNACKGPLLYMGVYGGPRGDNR